MLDLTTEAVKRLPAASLVSEATKMSVRVNMYMEMWVIKDAHLKYEVKF